MSPCLGDSTITQLPVSSPPSSIIPAAVTSLKAFGDSITAGTNVPIASQNWANMLALALGLPVTNFGVGGARLYGSGFIVSAYLQSPSAAVGSLCLAGTNDMSDAGLSAANRVTIGNALQALAVWLALPSSQVVLAGAMTASGFASSTTFAGLTAKFSSTQNDTLTATVTGSTIYVGGYVDAAFTSKFDVLVDGVSSSAGAGYSITNGMTNYTGHYPFCLRFSGYSSGSHTVVVKVLASSGAVPIQWVAGNGTSPQAPLVIIGGAMQQNLVANATVTAVNTVFSGIVASLASDGLNIFYVDDYSAIANGQTPATYNLDNTHPNIYGNSLICAKWLSTIYASPTYPSSAGRNGDAFSQKLFSGGLTAEALLAMYEWYQKMQPMPVDSGSGGKVLTQYIASTGSLAALFPGQILGNGVDLTAQGAAIPATLLFATSVFGGVYRIDWVASVTTVDGTSSTLGGAGGFQILYTDGDDSVVKTTPASASSSGNTTATTIGGSITVNAKNTTNIQYQFGYTSNTPGQMKYNLHVRYTKIG